MIRHFTHLVVVGLSLSIVGCSTPTNYDAFKESRTASILVLPPVNDSIDTLASYGYLSTITQPLSEHGYYVFPVSVIDHFLKENGLPSPREMHAIPLKKVKEVIGADAVMYITIKEYGTRYMIFDSVTTVEANIRLVDVVSGTELWKGKAYCRQSSSNGNSNLITIAVSQIVNTACDHAHTLSAAANQRAIANQSHGLLYGPRHKLYMTDHKK